MSKPLQGVRVVEMGSVVLAPYAAQILAELGADVVKVEPPKGDITRNQGFSRHPGMAALYLSCNRGKRSLVLDAKKPEGLQALERLLAGADVFLHNMRAATADRLGVGFEGLQVLNPRLVYCATYGYGAAGPHRDRPAYDDIIQAASGAAGLQQAISGTPAYMPTIVADKTTALFVVIGIQGALLRRAASGQGQRLEVPMFETMVHYLSVEHQAGLCFEPPLGPPGYQRMVSEFRRPHRTQDGFIAVMPHNERDWRVFFEACGEPGVMDDPRFLDTASRAKHINLLYERLSALMRTRTTAEWIAFLDRHAIPNSAINNLNTLREDEHLREVGFWRTFEHPSEGRLTAPSFPVNFHDEASAHDLRHAPRLGEHTAQILGEIGYDDAQVAQLTAQGAAFGERAPAGAL